MTLKGSKNSGSRGWLPVGHLGLNLSSGQEARQFRTDTARTMAAGGVVPAQAPVSIVQKWLTGLLQSLDCTKTLRGSYW